MTKKRRNIGQFFLCSLLVIALLLGCGCSKVATIEPAEDVVEPTEPVEPVYDGPVGYKAAAPCGEGFLACGTGGRIDYISMDGEVKPCESGTKENLLSIHAEGENALVSGENGTLLISNDSGNSFYPIDMGTDDTIYAATVFNGNLFAAGEGGIVYRQNEAGWEPVQMETENDLIGLVATNYCLAAISTETDVCISLDGVNWKHQIFNVDYKGLYPPYVFTRLVPAGDTFFVLGYYTEHPNIPLIMYTERGDLNGDVWMMKEMMKINNEYVSEEMELQIHDICFNIDQIVGVLDDGVVLSITECTECNESTTLEEGKDLWATAVQPEGVLVCGEDFFAKVISGKQIRQDKIKAEQAQNDLEFYGAVLIDVREDDELVADGYIPGSIHVPLAEVEERLPELVPDLNTEIIFYCASGKRSQTATELAIEMGYYSVYNLGGLGDWPYEIVKD